MLVDDVAHGVLTLNPDGSLAYTPDANFHGEDPFAYQACDPTGACDTATVTLTVTAVNDPPVADAGPDQTATVGEEVAFDGSGSWDVDNDPLSYLWVFVSRPDGSTAAFDDATRVTPTFTADVSGDYTVELTVDDGNGATDTDEVTVTASEAPNTAPVADANGPYTGTAGSAVSFDGSGSFDLDGTIVSYVWDFGDDSTGSGVAPDHTYPTPGPYTVTLTVTDDDGATATDTTNADITEAPNTAPVANAGPDQGGTVGDTVALDGSGSSDVDNDPLTFAWIFLARPPGSAASLTDPTSVAPSFTPDLPGDYTIELTIDDGNGGTATDTVTITAAAIGMTITLEDSLVGVGRTTVGTITLDNPAPPGGITVSLSLDIAIATVDPTEVPIAEGATGATFVLAGVAVGATTITGTSPVTETATADVQVTDSLISIDDIPIIAPEESADLPVSITKPAPPGGVTIHLESLDPTIAITDPAVFVPEGLYVPTANPQITGVAFGTTQIKATALAYGPDVRDVTVALQVTLTPAELDVPELWTLQVTAHLSAPAPSGGVTIDLSLDESLASVPASVIIPAGQTLSGPIDVTGGTTLGTTTLRASGLGLIEGTATITITQTPDVWLGKGVFATYEVPFVVGVDLQAGARVQLEVAPPGPVDVVVSVPAGSGVLLSASPAEAGSESLVVATGFTSTSSAPRTPTTFYVQGTIQGDDIDDDVPVTIEVFETGTTTPAGYEQADKPSNVDVGPSGFEFYYSADLDAPTFPNTDVPVVSYLLYDGEAGTLHNRRQNQEVRGGHTVTIDPANSAPTVGAIVAPALLTGGLPQVAVPVQDAYGANAVFDGLTPGTTTLGIIQPAGHTAPANGHTTRNVNVTAPDVWLGKGVFATYEVPFVVGVDLQAGARVQLEVAPPGPVDVVVSVPAGSGVLLSASPAEAGSESLVVATGFTSTSSAPRTPTTFYVQGTVQGDDIDDDVPVTIEVFETGTTTPAGYEQADKPSNVDVGPSGFEFYYSADLDTTTLSPDEDVPVVSYLLYDGEAGTLHNRRQNQEVRGGHTVTIDPANSAPTVGAIVAPALLTGGLPQVAVPVQDAYGANAVFDPLTPGTTTLDIAQPPGHTAPANGHTTRNVNVTAPDVWLGKGVFATYEVPFVVGVDLQAGARVQLEVAPPGPVDVVVSVPAGSGVLLSASPAEAGSESLVVATGFTSTSSAPRTPTTFYVQGTVQGDDIDDDVPVTIEVFETGTTTPAGYEQADKPSNVDVGPSGFEFYYSADLDTTTLSPDEDVPVVSYLLYDGEAGTLHNRRQNQEVRGGHTVTIDPANSAPTVGAIVAPALLTGGLPQVAVPVQDAYGANAVFDPLTPGTTTLDIAQPPGHTAPANGHTTRNVNVDAPDLWLYSTSRSTRISDQNLGRDLQVERRIALEVAPPAPGVDVTITVADPSVALISTDPMTVGTASVTFPLVTGTYTPLIYVQGLALNQGTELRVTAPGYDQGITTVQIVDSGFYIDTPSDDFSTTVDASNRAVRVRPASLDDLQRVAEYQMVRGGTNPSVEVISSDLAVGVITVSPLVFTGTDDYLTTAFDPIAVGTTTISITQPAGFLPPAGRTSIVATVDTG